jgi:hypothetical protein
MHALVSDPGGELDKRMNETESSMRKNWHSMEDSAKLNYKLSKKERMSSAKSWQSGSIKCRQF